MSFSSRCCDKDNKGYRTDDPSSPCHAPLVSGNIRSIYDVVLDIPVQQTCKGKQTLISTVRLSTLLWLL